MMTWTSGPPLRPWEHTIPLGANPLVALLAPFGNIPQIIITTAQNVVMAFLPYFVMAIVLIALLLIAFYLLMYLGKKGFDQLKNWRFN